MRMARFFFRTDDQLSTVLAHAREQIAMGCTDGVRIYQLPTTRRKDRASKLPRLVATVDQRGLKLA